MKTESNFNQIFNTPVEVGLRLLFLLDAVRPSTCDLQRAVIYDYLLVHSEDFSDAYPSLHPPTPFQSGELLIRRDVVAKGLSLVQSKGLIEKNYTANGIQYSATEIAPLFLEYMQSPYAEKCRQISTWVAMEFQTKTDEELRLFVHDNLGRWTSEFSHEFILRDEQE